MAAARRAPPLIVGPKPQPGSGPVIDRRVAATAPGLPVPPSFAGLSIEYWSVPDYIGSGGAVNPIFARLVGALAAGGHGPPTLRFGGNSTDETWWDPNGAARPVTITTDVTVHWLAHPRHCEPPTP